VAPPPGTATDSTTLSAIAGEYVAMFRAMSVIADKATAVDRQCQRLVAFRSEYEKVGSLLNIPWYFIGLIHGMESNFNFGLHLHNGDPLNLRTSHVPAGRPPHDVADPPFAWSTSAIDALRLKGLQTKADWSLPAILFRLEQYNGFGYRRRGLATPYLWSFSDRYRSGRFVRDRVFDPAATSKQVGAAVMLLRLVQQGRVALP
jgi:lysozyme family protein